jgi:hypothetical protein
MLWIPNTDSLHGLSGQLHALAALTRGEVAILLESRLDITQRQSRRFREEEYISPPPGNRTKIPRSSNHRMGGALHSPARDAQDWQEGLR